MLRIIAVGKIVRHQGRDKVSIIKTIANTRKEHTNAHQRTQRAQAV